MSDLLAGKTITGEGCAEVKEEKGESAEPEEPKMPPGHKEMTNDVLTKYHGEMDAFKETG